MQQRSKRLLAAAAILAVALVLYLIATAPQPSPQDQITANIETARAGVERRSASQVLTVVSADYKDAAIANTDQLHVLLIRTFRNSGPLAVSSAGNTITVTGDTARSVTHVTVKAADGGTTYFDGNIVLDWKREPSKRLLVFPSSTWRVVSAEYPNMPGFGGEY